MDLDPRKVIVSVLELGPAGADNRSYRVTLSYRGAPALHAEAEHIDYSTARAIAMDRLVELVKKMETH